MAASVSTNSTLSSSVLGFLTLGPVASLAQELLVLGVFFVSFMILRRLGRRSRLASRVGSKAGGAKRKLEDAGPDPPADVGRTGPSSGGGSARQRQVAATPSLTRRPAGGTSASTPALLRSTEQQMLKHLEAREFTRALNMYRALERDGRDEQFSEELYSAFIQSAIRVGKVDVVERMLRASKRAGSTPSPHFWQTMLKMLSSRKHFTACLTAYSIFGRTIPNDKVIYSCLINAALEVGMPERACQMLDSYSEANIEPKDHVLFFRTYVALNDVDSAEVVFDKLGDTNSALMLNLLLLICVNTKQLERGLGLLQRGHKLEKTASERIVDVVSYNTLIKGFAQTNSPEKCFQCLHEMSEHGLEPDDITFGTLLDAFIVNNDMGSAEKIGSLLMGDNKMNTVLSTLFIKGLVRANCLPKALEIYEEMKRREVSRPDIVTYSVLIKALVVEHDLDRALKLVEDMEATGHAVDDIILTHLLEGCRHAGNHDLGKKLFADLLTSGVKPSEYTLVTMLKLHGRCGAHTEAYDLVAGWEGLHGMKPSVIHYTCLMSGCLRTKSYDQAWAAYKLMCDNGITPDETTITTLLPGMVAARQWDKVVELVRMGLKGPKPVNMPPETLNSALSQMTTGGAHCLLASHLRAVMQEANIPLTARNARHLVLVT